MADEPVLDLATGLARICNYFSRVDTDTSFEGRQRFSAAILRVGA